MLDTETRHHLITQGGGALCGSKLGWRGGVSTTTCRDCLYLLHEADALIPSEEVHS